MSFGALVFVVGAALLLPGASANGQSSRAPDCTDWRECRQMVESALEAGEVEHAQDLAWRAVQRGPKDDADLMFLLARAQSRSGRPHDALVMIRRLAERGVRTEADTHPDLERMRALDAWPETEAIVARVNAGEPAKPVGATAAATGKPARGRTAEPAATSAAANTGAASGNWAALAARREPRQLTAPFGANETLRFSAERFVAAGLAYDAVSHRFVYGDRDGRKLRVVGVGLDHAVDLVRRGVRRLLQCKGPRHRHAARRSVGGQRQREWHRRGAASAAAGVGPSSGGGATGRRLAAAVARGFDGHRWRCRAGAGPWWQAAAPSARQLHARGADAAQSGGGNQRDRLGRERGVYGGSGWRLARWT